MATMSTCLANARFFSTSILLRAAASQTAKKVEPHPLPQGFRKPSPFACFFKEKLVEGEKPAAQMKRLSDEWKSLSDQDKKKYEDMSMKTAKEKATKFAALSVEEQQKLFENSEAKKERKHKKQLVQEPKHAPKALTGYNLFMKEKLSSSPREGEVQKDRLLKAAADWKQLSEAEKNKYSERAKMAGPGTSAKAEGGAGKK